MSDILSAIEKALENTEAAVVAPGAPTTATLVNDLAIHYEVADFLKPFVKSPAVLKNVDWPGYMKPSTRAVHLQDAQIVPADELAKLKKLQTEYQATFDEQIKYSEHAIHEDTIKQRTAIREAANDRSGVLPDGFRTIDSIRNEYRTKRQALDERLKAIVVEAFPFCRDVILRAELHLIEILKSFEESERYNSAAYDLPWEPSQAWKSAACILITARKEIRSFTGRPDQSPARLLAGYVTL
jgi:hypothetical protein